MSAITFTVLKNDGATSCWNLTTLDSRYEVGMKTENRTALLVRCTPRGSPQYVKQLSLHPFIPEFVHGWAVGDLRGDSFAAKRGTVTGSVTFKRGRQLWPR